MSTRANTGGGSVRRLNSVRMEVLESRELFSVSWNAAGWTAVSPSADTRTIYVSSSGGNDGNSGLSASSPVRSLGRAASMMRSGHADWMLLDRGDTWNGSFPRWNKSGRSEQEPMLIGTYGSGNRPLIATGAANGFVANTRSAVNNLVIDGIQFYADQRDPNSPTYDNSTRGATPTGFLLLGPSNQVTVEDCSFRFFKDNVVLEGAIGSVQNVTIRRSIISNSYCTSTRSQGFYATDVNGVTLQEDVFYHNGWNEQVPGAVETGYNHNIYYSYSAANMVVRGNIIAQASNVGVLARSGGVIDDNLFLQNAIGISYGNANGASSTAGGVTGEINGNVFLGDKGIGNLAMGEGIDIGNIKPGAGLRVENNIFSGDTQQSSNAISVTYANGTYNPGAAVGINDVTIENNITNGWRVGLAIDGRLVDGGHGLTGLNNLTVRNNDFQGSPSHVLRHDNVYNASQEHWSGNDYFTAALSPSNWFSLNGATVSAGNWINTIDRGGSTQSAGYGDPGRSIASYNATLGGGATLNSFLTQAVLQSGTNWRSAFTAQSVINYIGQGFNLAPVTVPTSSDSSGSITGTVFNDSNSNQRQDNWESGLSGWTVYVDSNNNGRLDADETSALTDSSGNYTFDNLTAGAYLVRAIRPSGWNQTTPANGFGQHLNLASGQQIIGASFGEVRIG